jgi:small subunit ribosomal protein S7
MRARPRDLTEKYKAFRLQPESLFLSRLVQTFFSKFTKKGKKALARRHIYQALTQFRLLLRRPKMYVMLLRIFMRLRVQFLLPLRRKGRQLVAVPVPVRRNKRDVLNIQALYRAIQKRRERSLSERIALELTALTFKHRQASTIRQRSSDIRKVYEARVDMDLR